MSGQTVKGAEFIGNRFTHSLSHSFSALYLLVQIQVHPVHRLTAVIVPHSLLW